MTETNISSSSLFLQSNSSYKQSNKHSLYFFVSPVWECSSVLCVSGLIRCDWQWYLFSNKMCMFMSHQSHSNYTVSQNKTQPPSCNYKSEISGISDSYNGSMKGTTEVSTNCWQHFYKVSTADAYIKQNPILALRESIQQMNGSLMLYQVSWISNIYK